MPKTTFLKLKQEKREQFIAVAIEEFARTDYEHASVSAIVANLGIAKGSLYQYFEDKKDLYFYLVEYAQQQKQQALAEVSKQQYADFWEMLVAIQTAATQFDLANPALGKLLYHLTQERHHPDLGDLHARTFAQSMQYFRKMLLLSQQQGAIRPEISVEILAYILVQIINEAAEYLRGRYAHLHEALLHERVEEFWQQIRLILRQ